MGVLCTAVNAHRMGVQKGENHMPYVWRKRRMQGDSTHLRFTIADPGGWTMEANSEELKLVAYDREGVRHMIIVEHLTRGTLLDWAAKAKRESDDVD